MERYGKLVVTNRASDLGRLYCRVTCDCGTEKDVQYYPMRNGKVTHCGCERSAPRLVGDYAGARYGRLVVLSMESDLGPKFWRVKCDCGTEKDVRHYEIRRKVGATISCGCAVSDIWKSLSEANKIARSNHFSKINALPKDHLVKNLVGQRFGKLVVVERTGSNKRGDARWLCKCDCGKTKTVTRGHLVQGSTASCGCAKLKGEVVRSEDARKYFAEYRKNRIATDLKFALENRVRTGIYMSLRRKGSKKYGMRWESLVGYDRDALHARLERTMPTGYTWDDFLSGRLHVDHIVPLAVHNYQSAEDRDFKRAWALENLQLLPVAENLSKSAKLSVPFQPSLSFGAAAG